MLEGDHDHSKSNRPEVMNVIAFLHWRAIGQKTGAHFS